ncbi:MAG: uroporphyrinogen-III C-methyltransferase [Acidobacteriaceae bacterium]
MTGKVYLVGAGPGDPELLTLRAARILGEAEVVLHDGLVSGEIVKLARQAEIIDAGKRCGNNKRVTQEQINAMLVEHARRGRIVVRLKGGDPLIFGRAGEEIAALQAAGIAYEIVPGVTTASCAAAAAGISLTCRSGASSLVFLPGHGGQDKSKNDWPDLNPKGSDAPDVTVAVYMPGTDYASLRDRLLAAGMAPSTPCLLVSGVGTDASLSHRTTVGELSSAPELLAPKILLAGEVVRAVPMTRDLASESRIEAEELAVLLNEPWLEQESDVLLEKA